MASRDASNPWSQPAPASAANSQKQKNHRKPQPKAKDSVQPPPAKSATKPDQFQLAQTKHIEAARKHVANDYESSSEEEDMASDSMLASIFKGYTGEKDQLNKTQQFLENVFQSGSAICLICIATVKRADYVCLLPYLTYIDDDNNYVHIHFHRSGRAVIVTTSSTFPVSSAGPTTAPARSACSKMPRWPTTTIAASTFPKKKSAYIGTAPSVARTTSTPKYRETTPASAPRS